MEYPPPYCVVEHLAAGYAFRHVPRLTDIFYLGQNRFT